MEPEWNNPPYLDDKLMLGINIDIDDYINNLNKQIKNLESIIQSLKIEIQNQRKEIAILKS